MSHSQLPVLFLLTVLSFSIFGCIEYNQSDFGIGHLVMSTCRVSSYALGRGCLLWPVCSPWQNSVSLCPASFSTPRPNLSVTSGISWLPTFAFQERFQILKDDAVKMLPSIGQQIWKTQQWPQDWKMSVFIPIPQNGNVKECSNYHTTALITHASKVMLKILQARFQ